jgi:hypothetical protein
VTYGIHSSNYLERARRRLEEQTLEGLFYAALELRFGIEARLQQYREALSEITRQKLRKEWQVPRLAADLEKAFSMGDKIVEITVIDPVSQVPRAVFLYTPVNTTLQTMAGKLGGILHCQSEYRRTDDPWWKDTRDFLEQVCSELSKANRGTLLCVPLLNRATKQFSFITEVEPGQTEQAIQTVGSVGERLEIHVAYLDSLP